MQWNWDIIRGKRNNKRELIYKTIKIIGTRIDWFSSETKNWLKTLLKRRIDEWFQHQIQIYNVQITWNSRLKTRNSENKNLFLFLSLQWMNFIVPAVVKSMWISLMLLLIFVYINLNTAENCIRAHVKLLIISFKKWIDSIQ